MFFLLAMPGVAGADVTYTDNPSGRIVAYEQGPDIWTNLASGMNNNVRALLHDGTRLYAGGIFMEAGGVVLDRIAMWNGTTWTNLGGGINGGVTSLAHDGTNLYAGGQFTTAGGQPANRVAMWDGTSWTNLGSGVNSIVNALLHDGVNLYAGGFFTNSGGVSVNYVAMWDGTSWTSLGDGLETTVNALAHDGVNLYAGGFFTNASGVTANYVAKWDGASWTSLGTGLGSTVNALAHDGENLYAGGPFSTAGGQPASRVAMWDGTSWTNLGSGADNAVWALAHDGANLYAGGFFSNAGGQPASRVAMWNGTSWTNLGSGVTEPLYVLVHDGTNLYAGGMFTNAGGVAANRVAKWGPTFTEINPVQPSSGSWVGGYQVVISGIHLGDGADITNVTLCGVAVTNIASQSSTQVVVWAGQSLTPGIGDVRVFSASLGETARSNAFTYTGAGIEVSGPAFGPVRPGSVVTNIFTVTNAGTEALVITTATNSGAAAGMFDVSALAGLTVAPGTASNFPVVFTAGGPGTHAPVCHVANNSPVPGYTFGLTGHVFQASTNVGPLAGGNVITITNGFFGNITNVLVGATQAGATQAGATQGATCVSPLQAGDTWFTIVVPPAVHAGVVDLIVQTSDRGETILANAYTYNPPGQIIAYEQGPDIWTNLASGVNDCVYALAYAGTRLYAGGIFTEAGGQPANRVAMWDGTGWTNLGSGMEATVNALAHDGVNLYAGGQFTSAGGVAANYVAMWDGTSWTGLGSGVNGGVNALAHDGTHLYAGGQFTSAGGVAVNYVAMWNGTSWTNLGSGKETTVNALAHDGTNLYAGGVSVNYVAMWNGTSWTNLGGGMNNTVNALAHDGMHLYAGGEFNSAGGVGESFVAMWEGTHWTALGGGLDNTVYALAHDGTSLYVGGLLRSASDVAASRVAKWGPTFTEINPVQPSSGSWTGGYQVVIRGVNLCNGSLSDVTLVTLAGVTATVQHVHGSTQIVVVAGTSASGAGMGDVVVVSTDFGTTVRSNAFESLKEAQTITFAPIGAKVYGDSAFDPGATVSSGLTVTYASGNPNVATNLGAMIYITGTGTTEIVASQAGDAFYFAAPNVTNTLTVTPKGLTVTNTVASNKVYDATTTAWLGGATLVGAVDGDDVVLANATTGTFAQAIVGTNIVVSTHMTLAGTRAPHYTLTQPEGLAADITTRGLIVTGAVAASKVYDGTTAATLSSGGGLSGIQGSDNVTLENNATGTFAHATAGTNIAVTTYMSLGGGDAPNYTLSQPSLAADITKASQTITFDALGDQFWTNVLTLSATASSGLDVVFEVVSGPAELTGLTELTFTGYGAVVVRATQVGDDNWHAAADVDRAFEALGPQFVLLGTNGQEVVSGEEASVEKGTDFGEAMVGADVLTHAFVITNAGNAVLTISGVSTGGVNPAAFAIFDFNDQVAAGTSETFLVMFDPVVFGSNTAHFSFTHDGTNSPYVLHVAGEGRGVALTVASEYGVATPSTGVYEMAAGGVFTNWMQTPDERGATQYVSTGWVVTGGLDPTSGEGTQAVVTVTGEGTLTWLWSTNYWLETSVGPHGDVNVGDGWQPAGETTQITATADRYYAFSEWTGDVPGGEEHENPLDLVMDEPKSVMAHFEAVMTTNRPTPHWWLAWHGFAEADFETVVDLDLDGDGIPTGDEWIMDTDPTDSNSFLRVVSMEALYGPPCSDVVWTNDIPPYEVVTQTVCTVVGHILTWPCSTSRVYDVEYNEDFPLDIWLPLEGMTNLVPTSDSLRITNRWDEVEGPGDWRIYRLRVRMPE